MNNQFFLRAQPGNLAVSPEKQSRMDKEFALHFRVLKRVFERETYHEY